MDREAPLVDLTTADAGAAECRAARRGLTTTVTPSEADLRSPPSERSPKNSWNTQPGASAGLAPKSAALLRATSWGQQRRDLVEGRLR